jgi:hypothetical protein
MLESLGARWANAVQGWVKPSASIRLWQMLMAAGASPLTYTHSHALPSLEINTTHALFLALSSQPLPVRVSIIATLTLLEWRLVAGPTGEA